MPASSKLHLTEQVAIVGLGYVGLPLAVALARKWPVTGIDVSQQRVAELIRGEDRTMEVAPEELRDSTAIWTTDARGIKQSSIIIVTVPTPVDHRNSPDLGPLRAASETVGKHLSRGSIVVFESTVYPGATREVCVPILEASSGLTSGRDFTVGYSPERINPGDKLHNLSSVVKVVSGQDPATTDRLAAVYGSICEAGIHIAPSIEVAEAAKVIENTQRDLNIALMNELSLIFDRLDIRTRDVLAAARTKWNFLDFTPGLVGGHCIGVDPYYLTFQAQAHGYHPEVILAGRRLNDAMGQFLANKTLKLLAMANVRLSDAKICVVGVTFKSDVPDIRNSKVPDMIREFADYGLDVVVHDPMASARDVSHEYGINLQALPAEGSLDALVFAVPHLELCDSKLLCSRLRHGGVLLDVKSVLDSSDIRPDVRYWAL